VRRTTIPIAALACASALAAGPAPASADDYTGVVKVVTEPSGAEVYVAGKLYGRTALLMELPVGQHKIRLRYEGYRRVAKIVTVKKDRILHTRIALEEEAPDPPMTPKARPGKSRKNEPSEIRVHKPEDSDEPGTIHLATTPSGLTVFMDGMIIPQPTPVAFDIRQGIYELTIEQESNVVYRKTVFVRGGHTLELDLTITKRRQIDYTDPWK